MKKYLVITGVQQDATGKPRLEFGQLELPDDAPAVVPLTTLHTDKIHADVAQRLLNRLAGIPDPEPARPERPARPGAVPGASQQIVGLPVTGQRRG